MKKRSYFLIVMVLILFITNSCATIQRINVTPAESTHLGTIRVLDKNYEIGQKQSAYVGKPIMKVKDYYVAQYKAGSMRASHDFVIQYKDFIKITGDTLTDYKIRGETIINGEKFTILDVQLKIFRSSGIREIPDCGLLIKNDGSVHRNIIHKDKLRSTEYTVYPPELRFIPSKEEKIVKTKGYINYELIYGGTDGKSLTIIYREYTPDDLARPAYYLNLVYELRQDIIRFRDSKIQVHEATNEKIVYTILEDGY